MRATAVLRGATLIDGTGGKPRPGCTIVIEGDRLARSFGAALAQVGEGVATIQEMGASL